MSNDEVTTVAADFMYLVILGDSDIIDNIATEMNKEATNNNTNKIYKSIDIDIQVDYLPETPEFQDILMSDVNKRIELQLPRSIQSSDSDDLQNSKKYFVMGEGVETAQCYTCGEGYVNVNMLIEIEAKSEHFTITYPVLNLDDEVNPEDLISSWIINNNISHVADNLHIRLVNMVGTNHDILVFAAFVNKSNNSIVI
jgi:hypothetical protein